jgi:amino acid adenylation domain-containing protein
VSPRQKAAWYRDQFEPGQLGRFHAALYRFRGYLDIAVLENCFTRMAQRHEILRTTYHNNNRAPMALLCAPRPQLLTIIDLRSVPEKERESRARAVAGEEARRRFDLSVDPLLRAVLLQLRGDEYFLLLAGHDTAWDDYSAGIAVREITALYNNALGPGRSDLAEKIVQYEQAAREEQKWLAGAEADEQLDYWKERLAGSPYLLSLPAARPRGPRPSWRGARETMFISGEYSDRLKSIAQNEEVDLSVALLGLFHVLLHRYTGNEEIVIGCAMDSRRNGTERSIGPFANSVALHQKLSGRLTFRDLLADLRGEVGEARARRRAPFESIVEALHIEPDASCAPVFQTTFQFREAAERSEGPCGLKLEEIDFDPGVAYFDLSLQITKMPGGLQCGLQYSTELFEAETIRQILGHYRTALEAVTAKPDLQIADIPILTAAEREQILVEWNRTTEEIPQRSVQQLFEYQVQRTPDAIAVVDQNRQLTYRELNTQANQLARRLMQMGVGTDVIVGVCVKRSVDIVVGLLAALKAGGAYLPLDLTHPSERLNFMLQDSQARVLLCDKRLTAELNCPGTVMIPVEEWKESSENYSGENIPSSARPSDLAYVIYTSGSTGKPKGVLIPQIALVNLLCSMRRWFDFSAKDVLLAVTTMAFDIAAVDIWLPLITGARVVMVSRQAAVDGDALLDALACRNATFMQATPATWRLLLEAGWQGKADLQAVCTGEPMPRDLAEQLRSMTGRLWNMYGPTETTVWSTGFEVKTAGRILIGKPVGNTTTYILDSNLQPVPAGVTGELHIGGIGLARGYLGMDDVTQRKFIPDPFAGSSEARMYKTGDLARYQSDGNIECLGRTDFQVKIRGFRIELNEIEAVLCEHADVHEAVVTVGERSSGHRFLIAYVVPAPASTLREEQLRSLLKQKLPDYMLPARYEFLSSLPRTANRKVDRNALPSPAAIAPRQPAAPQDDLELQLLAMWEDILQTSPINLQDDFFDLGGESLLAAKLLKRIEKLVNQKIPLSVLLHAPTIERLARTLRDFNAAPRRSCALREGGSRPPFLCVGAGPLFRNLAKRLGPDQPFLTLLREDDAPATLEEIAAYHVETIRMVQPEGPYFIGGWSDTGIVAYEVARQLRQQGRHVGLLALFDAENEAAVEDLDSMESFRARVDSICQWVNINWNLLRGSGREDALRRIRESIGFRLALTRRRFRRVTGIPLDKGDALAMAVAAYRPQPYGGPTVLFQRTARPTGRFHNPTFGWGRLVDQLMIQEIPGDHKDMFLEPNVRILADELGRRLVDAGNRYAIELTQDGNVRFERARSF